MQIYRPQIVEFESNENMRQTVSTFFVDKFLDINGDKGNVRMALDYGENILNLCRDISHVTGLDFEKLSLFQIQEILGSDTSYKQEILDSFGPDFADFIGEKCFFDINLPVEMTLKNYREELENLDGILFDLTILDIKSDDTLAGLFPNQSYLSHQEDMVIKTVTDANYNEKYRYSMTVETILNSEEILLLVSGEENREFVSKFLSPEISVRSNPAKFLLAHPKVTVFQVLEN
jgi:6-phosphogluconolactonase/glucosamine-6-phosphate isomerase/deaminase